MRRLSFVELYVFWYSCALIPSAINQRLYTLRSRISNIIRSLFDTNVLQCACLILSLNIPQLCFTELNCILVLLLKFNLVCSLNKLVYRVTLKPHVNLGSISLLKLQKARRRGILAMRASEEFAFGRLTSVTMSAQSE